MSMKYLLNGKIMQFYRLLGGTYVSLINNLLLLNYDKRYVLFNECNLSMHADSQTVKRRVDDMFINYFKEKL